MHAMQTLWAEAWWSSLAVSSPVPTVDTGMRHRQGPICEEKNF